jgi:hypothetical protein
MKEEHFSNHIIHYMNEDGSEENVNIEFKFDEVEYQDIGKGEVYELHKVIASFELLNEGHSIRAYGDNRVQAVLRAMQLIGIVALDVAEEHGIEFYKYESGDAVEPLDLFS